MRLQKDSETFSDKDAFKYTRFEDKGSNAVKPFC